MERKKEIVLIHTAVATILGVFFFCFLDFFFKIMSQNVALQQRRVFVPLRRKTFTA